MNRGSGGNASISTGSTGNSYQQHAATALLHNSSSYSATQRQNSLQQQCESNKVDGSNYAMSDEQLFKSAEATLQRSLEQGGLFSCKSEQSIGMSVGELSSGLAADNLSCRKFTQRGMESPCSQASSASIHSEATHGPLTPPATPAFLTSMVRSSPSQVERIQRDTAFSRVQMMSSPSSDFITHNDYGLNHGGYSSRVASDAYRGYPQIYHHSPYTTGFGTSNSSLPHVTAAYSGCPSTSSNYGIGIGGSDFDRYLDVEDRKLPYVYKTATGTNADDSIQELNPVMSVSGGALHNNNNTSEQNSTVSGTIMRNNSLSPTISTTAATTINPSNGIPVGHAVAAMAVTDTDNISIPNHGGFFYHPDHHLPTYQYWSNNYSSNT